MSDWLIVTIEDKMLTYQGQHCQEGSTDCDDGG